MTVKNITFTLDQASNTNITNLAKKYDYSKSKLLRYIIKYLKNNPQSLLKIIKWNQQQQEE